jgi:hypothetical protein
MDPAYISAFAALAGSVIGGVTSLVATWLSQNAQARMQQIIQAKIHRQDLYRAFIEEASRLYADALVSEKAEVGKIVGLYAMTSRMRVLSTPAVVDAAETAIHAIVAEYFKPNRTLRELHDERENLHATLDPLRAFSDAARADLTARGVV